MSNTTDTAGCESEALRPGYWMQTYSGGRFWPLDPRPEDFDLADIAHALAGLSRFGGHTVRPYSVAQHSVIVSRLVAPELALHALMHDAAEAYLGDPIRPLKISLPGLQAAEDRLRAALVARWPDVGPADVHPDVKRADNVALATERRDLYRSRIPWPAFDALGIEPLPSKVSVWPAAVAEQAFLATAHVLAPPGLFRLATERAMLSFCSTYTVVGDGAHASLESFQGVLHEAAQWIGMLPDINRAEDALKPKGEA